jgi:hypothetical protein
MNAHVIEITATVRVRPVGASMPDGRAGEKNPHALKGADAIAARPTGVGKRGRGRPSKAPAILALLPTLTAFHGPRLLLDDIVEAAVSQGVLEHADPRTPSWIGRRQEGRLKDVDGLVLDLRGGWGGAQPEYTELFVGGAPIMTYVGRDGRENFASFRWRRPVVVLVDEGTRSGKEVVTYGLKRQGVRVVGTRTAGARGRGGVESVAVRASGERFSWRSDRRRYSPGLRPAECRP